MEAVFSEEADRRRQVVRFRERSGEEDRERKVRSTTKPGWINSFLRVGCCGVGRGGEGEGRGVFPNMHSKCFVAIDLCILIRYAEVEHVGFSPPSHTLKCLVERAGRLGGTAYLQQTGYEPE